MDYRKQAKELLDRMDAARRDASVGDAARVAEEFITGPWRIVGWPRQAFVNEQYETIIESLAEYLRLRNTEV